MVRIVLTVLGLIVLAVLIRMMLVIIPASGALTPVTPFNTAQCEAIEIAPGTEDVTFDPALGLAFVSAAERRTDAMSSTNGIYVFDPAIGQDSVRLVSIDAPADFRPHGISLWHGETEIGEALTRLFVISHPYSGHQVLIYDVADTGALTHVQTVSHAALHSPNDLVAVGPTQFYATNDVYFGDTPMGYLESFLGLPLGSVSYYDGREGAIAATGLVYANGINVSADGETLYAAALLGRALHVFDRDITSGTLTRTARHRVPLGLDNIERAEDGALYIAGNVEVFSFLAHEKDPSQRAPSQAVRVDPQTGDWQTVFASFGDEIDSASVIAPAGDQLVLGAVFDSHVLVCPNAD